MHRLTSSSSLAGITLSILASKMFAIQIDGVSNMEEYARAESVRVLYPCERVDLIVQLGALVEIP